MSKKIKKIKFRRSDFLRALLTDTLPYEVPLFFSNSGFYERLTSGVDVLLRDECKIDLLPKDDWAIPYTYNIKKDSLDFRNLSIVHPAIQRDFCELYKEYGQLIIGLCSRSEFTLRKPTRVATHYYERARASKTVNVEHAVEVEENGFARQGRHASSYFSYERYNLIHKFYESPEFHRLEKKFRLLRRLDISKCFNHIYTHSIAWAAKNKQFGKENKSSETFEGRFDDLMQHANYDETNGIVIGPEVSRLFAEIILQKVDTSLQKSLADEDIISPINYDIRRYVDDYFVFSNDERLLDSIQSELSKQLSKFKLYLNTAKTSSQTRPFVTGQSGAKIEIASLVDRMFEQHVTSAKAMREALKEYTKMVAAGTAGKRNRPFPIRYVGNAATLAASYIRETKQIVAKYNTDFDSVSNYFFSIASRKTLELVTRIDTKKSSAKEFDRLTRFLRTILECVFFVYAMSPRVRATYQVSSLCFSISDFCSSIPRDARESVKGFMAEQMRGILREAADGGEGDNIEVVNLIAVLRSFGNEYLLSTSELLHIYGVKLDEKGQLKFGRGAFGYFQIVTLLSYIGGLPQYAAVVNALCDHVQQRFDAEVRFSGIQQNSELTMLAFDFVRCPYIPAARKEHFAKELLRKVSSSDLNARLVSFLKAVEGGDWFFAWTMKDALGELLWKKELRTAY